MAKKFSKLVLFSALAGAAAAGTYYYLQNKAKEIIGEMTSANAEPVYTEMDMSAVPADKKEETASVSATYTEASGTENSSEEFFNDSESK